MGVGVNFISFRSRLHFHFHFHELELKNQDLVLNLISFRTLLLAQDHQVGLQEEEADPGGGRGRRRGAGAGLVTYI